MRWRVSRRGRRIRGGLCSSHRRNCKGKKKRKVSEGCKGRLDCERRMKKTNERKFVMMGEMEDEALSTKREKKKKQPTAYGPGS